MPGYRDTGTGRHRTHGARNHLSGILLTKAAFKLELEQDKASQKSLLNVRALVQSCSLWHPWDSFLGHTHFQLSQPVPAPSHHSASTLPTSTAQDHSPVPGFVPHRHCYFPMNTWRTPNQTDVTHSVQHVRLDPSLMGACCWQPKCSFSSLKCPTLGKENISEVLNYIKGPINIL